jgi:hypothetical protein
VNPLADPAVAAAFVLAMRNPTVRHVWMRRALRECERRASLPDHDRPAMRAAAAMLREQLQPEPPT